MLISAAVIVKDGERYMERCVACLSQFADEIVIVDTGSTDRTKQIAKDLPKVRLHDSAIFDEHTPVRDFSFSKAKNEAIRLCRGDWVIWWDVDDFIEPEGAAKVRRIADETVEPCLYSFSVTFGPLRFEHCRMFRNGLGILFDETHSCHEYLNTRGHPNIQRRDVVVEHVPGPKGNSSLDRNVQILEADYHDRGIQDARTTFYLANTYREMNRDEEAIPFYDEYLGLSEWSEERAFARYFKAQSLVKLGRFGEAAQEALLSVNEDDRFAEVCCLLGDLAMVSDDLDEAERWYGKAAAMPFPEDARMFVVRALYEEYPRAKMAECHRARKESGDSIGPFSVPSEDVPVAAGAMEALGACLGQKVLLSGVPSSVAAVTAWVIPHEDDAAPLLDVPAEGRGKSRHEWYCRSAGHALSDVEIFNKEAQRATNMIRRVIGG